MQFLLIAHDHTDDEALTRRMATRTEHLARAEALAANGTALFATAILNDEGQMVGSVMVFDFPSRAELDASLAEEPYVTGKVWGTIDISPTRVGPAFAARLGLS